MCQVQCIGVGLRRHAQRKFVNMEFLENDNFYHVCIAALFRNNVENLLLFHLSWHFIWIDTDWTILKKTMNNKHYSMRIQTRKYREKLHKYKCFILVGAFMCLQREITLI